MAERQPIPILGPQRAPHEGGNGAPGLPRTVHESSKPPPPESQERQPLPSVWEYLERFTRLNAPDVEDRPRWGTQKYHRELSEVQRLERELREKGTARDNLIHTLYTEVTMEPTGSLPVPADFKDLSLVEFLQFQSRVEPMSEEQIRDEIHKAKEEYERKEKAIRGNRHRKPDDPYSLARP